MTWTRVNEIKSDFRIQREKNNLAILLAMDDFEMKLDIFDLKPIIFFQNFGP